jgi:hypothetical protein
MMKDDKIFRAMELIASRELLLETLKPSGQAQLDTHEHSVDGIATALRAAFDAGHATARQEALNEAALEAFMTKTKRLENELQHLQALAESYYDIAPGEINWGRIGDLDMVIEQLTQMTDILCQEGEGAI